MATVIQIWKTKEFVQWFEKQSNKTKVMIDARLDRIAYFEHFGTTNRFDNLIELKWRSGLRIYGYQVDCKNLIILLGGTKNGQQYDISQAKKILNQIT